MKNIEKIESFKSHITKNDLGTITILTTENEVSAKESISFSGKSLITSYVYKKHSTYNLIYTLVDTEGNAQSYVEDDGILPILFLSPNQENYVSITPYHPDKELEISIPIFNRDNIELPKGNRPFVGDFIGISNQYSIFFNADLWSDTKPDKLLSIEFKNGLIKKKHNIKIEFPRENKIFIFDNEIHLLSNDGSNWLHRQIDELGNEIRKRKIITKNRYFTEIISLSFDQNSYLLTEVKGKILIEKIDPDGKGKTIDLINITDTFYNTWRPVNIADNTFVTRFNTEFGNGWFTIKNDSLLDFYYSKDVKGYKNLLTGNILEMDYEDLIISSINKTKENCYAVVFYPNTQPPAKSTELIVLNISK